MRSRLYLFNSFGILNAYVVVAILNFVLYVTPTTSTAVYEGLAKVAGIASMDQSQLLVGLKRVTIIPLVSFDTVINIYLTIIFPIPL